MDLLEKVQMENLDEEQKMLAELIGLEAFKSLVRAFNGTSIYIPKTGSEIWIDRNVDSQYSFRQSKRDKSQTDRWSDESYGLLRMNIFS